MFYDLSKWSLVLGSCMIAASAQTAPSWINVGPVTSGDVKAYVDYQVHYSIPEGDIWQGQTPQGPASYLYETKPLWVNIHRGNLNPSDRVFVQIIQYAQTVYRGQFYNTQKIVERDLEFAEPGRFTGEFERLRLDYQLNDGYALSGFRPYKYEIVVWINGELYKDRQGQNLILPLPKV